MEINFIMIHCLPNKNPTIGDKTTRIIKLTLNIICIFESLRLKAGRPTVDTK